MSGFVNLTPGPVLLGAMAPTDQDGAWLIDATANMQARGTTIASIGTPVVSREDGQAIGAGDLTVSNAQVQAAGLKWSFSAQANNVAVYLIAFPLTLATGDVITRTVQIPVISPLG